jgi:hypothetical protein
MKKTFFLLCLSVFTFSVNAQQADYIFKNANIITMKDDKVVKNQYVVVKNGKIIEISNKTKYKSDNTVDIKGKYLLPSMADAHIHFPESDEEFEKVLKLNLINGITKVRSMRGDWNDFHRREKYNTKDSYFPKLYISPPPISRNHDLSIEDIESYVKSAKDYSFDFIKTLSVKNPNLLRQIDSICKNHNIVMAGHFPDNSKGIRFSDDLTFSTNYNAFEHLGGLVGQPESYDNRMKLIKKNNIFICPTLQWYAIGYGQYEIDEMLNQRGMEYVSEELKKEWAEGTKTYRGKLGKDGFEEEKKKYALEMQERFNVVKQLNEQGTLLLLSPDSSSKFIVSGFGMFEEMKLYKKAKLSNFDILKSATTNFALLFNENYGTIEIGKDADFILVNENPLEKLETLEKIEGVFYNNQYLNNNKLNEIAKSVLPVN